MRFLAAWALASAGGAPCAFAVVRLPETSARDSIGRDTGYVLHAHESGRFMETSLPGVAGRDAPTARPQGSSRAFTYAYDHRGRMVRKVIARTGSDPQGIAYTWDDWNIIRETLVTRHSSLVTHNVWGLDLDGTLQAFMTDCAGIPNSQRGQYAQANY